MHLVPCESFYEALLIERVKSDDFFEQHGFVHGRLCPSAAFFLKSFYKFK